MADLKRDTICARRRFNPLARCELVFALKPAVRRHRRRKSRRLYTRKTASRPVVARV